MNLKATRQRRVNPWRSPTSWIFLLGLLIFGDVVLAETWNEDSVDFTLDPSGALGGIVSKAWAWDIHGSGYLNFAELAATVEDDEWDKTIPIALDAAILYLSKRPDDLPDWKKDAIGAVSSDGSTSYCCTTANIQKGDTFCDENKIGQLVVNADRDEILKVDHRRMLTTEFSGMTGVVSVDETEHMILVFGYCDDVIDNIKETKAPPVRIKGPLIGVSYVSGNTLPLYAVLAILVTALTVWYRRLMTEHIDSRIQVEEWIFKTLSLSAVAQVLEMILIATEVYSNNEPIALEFFSDALGSVASAASRCLYLVLALGLGVVTSQLSKTTHFMLGTCLGGYVLGLCVIDAMDVVERGSFIAFVEQIVFVMDVVFLVWIPCALCKTMKFLNHNGEELKLVRYRWILRIYGLAILMSIVQIFGFFFDMIRNGGRNYDLESVREGNEVIHVVVLVCIAYLWKPNPSQQQYAYVLLEEDQGDADCDDMTRITDLELTEVVNGGEEVVIDEEDQLQGQQSNYSDNHIA